MRRHIRYVIPIFAIFVGQLPAQESELPTDSIKCEYARLSERDPFPAFDLTKLAAVSELEPNNNASSAQAVILGFDPGQQPDVNLSGSITSFDQDFYKFSAKKGEILGVAVLAMDSDAIDSVIRLQDSSGSVLIVNDDHQIGSTKIADLYPPESPMPAGGFRRDAIFTFVFPADGTYYLRVTGKGAAVGKYVAQLRLRRPSLADEPAGTRQILFLDFDGATVNAKTLFGEGGNPVATLSAFDTFLPRWGIAAAGKDALIDSIVAKVQAEFDEVLASGGSDVGIEIRSSRIHPDEFGTNPYVSRVIVGGTIQQLSISTIGIAECVDPGNFSHNDTAVVLLDLLSAPASNPNSILGLPRAASVTLEEAIAKVVATVVSHEAGHFLGCWHTENSNDVNAIMDQGGSLANTAGLGTNGTLDQTDPLNRFVRDLYANEGIGRSIDNENCDARIRNALAVGKAPNPLISQSINNIVQTQLRAVHAKQESNSAITLKKSREAVMIDTTLPIAREESRRLLDAIQKTEKKRDYLKGMK